MLLEQKVLVALERAQQTPAAPAPGALGRAVVTKGAEQEPWGWLGQAALGPPALVPQDSLAPKAPLTQGTRTRGWPARMALGSLALGATGPLAQRWQAA